MRRVPQAEPAMASGPAAVRQPGNGQPALVALALAGAGAGRAWSWCVRPASRSYGRDAAKAPRRPPSAPRRPLRWQPGPASPDAPGQPARRRSRLGSQTASDTAASGPQGHAPPDVDLQAWTSPFRRSRPTPRTPPAKASDCRPGPLGYLLHPGQRTGPRPRAPRP